MIPIRLIRYGLSTLFAVFIAAILVATLPTAHAAAVLYVSPSPAGNADCTSWANACSLQDALQNAASGDQIWVQAGVYLPTSTATDRNAFFPLPDGVAVYGGFDGTETALSERNPVTNITVLSGDIDNNDTVDATGVITDALNIAGNNSYYVVRALGAGNTAVLDGFTITGGKGNYSTFPFVDGGGMNLNNSSPTLTNLTFSGNLGGTRGGGLLTQNGSTPSLTNITFRGNRAVYGGGLYNEATSPVLANVTFDHNTAINSGDGVYNLGGAPSFTHVTFTNNFAASNGGGMHNESSSPVFSQGTFDANAAGVYGGGVFIEGTSQPSFTDVTFSSNTAVNGGGGLFNSSTITLTNNVFSSNEATNGSGGGLYSGSGSNAALVNVTLVGNQAASYGGGMYVEYSQPTLVNVVFSGNAVTATGSCGGGLSITGDSPSLINVTFSGNTAVYCGGGLHNNSSNVVAANTIIWGNNAPNGQNLFNENVSMPTISYSNIGGSGGSASWDGGYGIDGGGNIDSDPLFVDADGADNTSGTIDDDLHLEPASPSIDAGSNAAVPSGITTDRDGNARFVDVPAVTDTGNGTSPLIDMGAYESQSAQPPNYPLYLPVVIK